MALLEITQLNRRFGGLHAIKDLSFAVEPGLIKALIGPNGAGKSTLFNLIAGSLRPDSGAIFLRGERIDRRAPFEIARRRVSRTFQTIKLFPRMTVLETVMVGRHRIGKAGFAAAMLPLPWTWKEERDIRGRALETLDALGLAALADRQATQLSFGQQRAVELARALASEPELLLLDEPAAGLNIAETQAFGGQIRRIRDRGVTVLLVEHDMSLVMEVSDDIVVLDHGEKIAEGPPRRIQGHPDVIRVYLGEDDAQDS